jgi:hypothetical protein
MMNERMYELLIESGLQAYYDAQEAQIKKFALSIVRECATTAYQHDPVNPICTQIADEIYQRMVTDK